MEARFDVRVAERVRVVLARLRHVELAEDVFGQARPSVLDLFHVEHASGDGVERRDPVKAEALRAHLRLAGELVEPVRPTLDVADHAGLAARRGQRRSDGVPAFLAHARGLVEYGGMHVFAIEVVGLLGRLEPKRRAIEKLDEKLGFVGAVEGKRRRVDRVRGEHRGLTDVRRDAALYASEGDFCLAVHRGNPLIVVTFFPEYALFDEPCCTTSGFTSLGVVRNNTIVG